MFNGFFRRMQINKTTDILCYIYRFLSNTSVKICNLINGEMMARDTIEAEKNHFRTKLKRDGLRKFKNCDYYTSRVEFNKNNNFAIKCYTKTHFSLLMSVRILEFPKAVFPSKVISRLSRINFWF